LVSCLGYFWASVPAVAEAQARDGLRRNSRQTARAPQQAAVDGAASPASRRAIDAVYQLAASANSVGQLEQAMEQCSQLRQQSLSAEDTQYVRQLQAWLLNRRGEAYSTAAERAMDQQQEAEAVRLERLAIADFTAATEIDQQWRAFHNRGVSLAILGKYDEAIASFGQAIELNPTFPNARFNRAELWLETGRYDLAEKDYAEVVRLDSRDVAARIGRGLALFYLTRFEEARAELDAAIELQPENAIAHADRADLHAFMGRWEEAAQDYRAAIQLDRQLGRAYQSAAWLMATCPDQRYRDVQLALRSAERALELDGATDYRYLDTLAAAQASAGQFPEAIQSVEQAIAVAPADVRPELQQRLTLYQAQRPFRDEAR
jgi:tetratricopeptide (TPR) repeat protein